MSKAKKPKRLFVTMEFEVDMECWDDDVDWSDPEKVIRDQYDDCGLEFTMNRTAAHDGIILSVNRESNVKS